MSRELPEWWGKTDDAPIPDRVRLRKFLVADGRCQFCTRRITASDTWALDHRVALVNGGQHREGNLQVLCSWCHARKTKADVAEKSRTYKRRKSHYGLRKAKNPMPGSRASKFKKRMDGTVEIRSTHIRQRDAG